LLQHWGCERADGTGVWRAKRLCRDLSAFGKIERANDGLDLGD
jgi:hypothetical protein